MPRMCPGSADSPCCFSAHEPGRAAQRQTYATCAAGLLQQTFARRLALIEVQELIAERMYVAASHEHWTKVICDPARLADACLQPQSRGYVKRLLLALAPEYQRLALERVPEEFRRYFETELAKPWICVGMDSERCTFALSARGGPAQVKGRAARCVFCRPEDLWPMCEDEAGKREAGMSAF